MERRFTGFLIPILIVTMLYLVFFTGDDKKKDDAATAASAVQDPMLQDPGVKAQIAKQPPDSMAILSALLSETTLGEIEPESAAVTNAQIEEFNKVQGTDVKPGLTAVPFQDKK